MSISAQRARQREQREITRRQILDAADDLLRHHAFRELSVETVMAETGQTRTAFYRHFDDITDLVLRLLEEIGDDLRAVALRWSNRAGEGYPVAAREALSAIVEFFVRHGPLVRAISEAAAGDERIEREYRRGLDALIGLTKFAIERLGNERGLRVPDSQAMAVALNLMNEAYLLEEFGREPYGDPTVAQATLETVWLRVLGPER